MSNWLEKLVKTPEEAIRAISSREELIESWEVVKALLANPPSQSIQLAAIRKTGLYGSRENADLLLPLLKHQSASVVAATIKAVGGLDVSSLAPLINRLLQQKNPRISSAAIEIYARYDQETAIAYLSNMLRSMNPSIRKQALSLFLFVEFEAVAPILLRQLSDEPVQELKILTGFLIASNPSVEGMRQLYKVTHDSNGKVVPDYHDLWEAAVQGAVPMVFPDAASIEKVFRDESANRKRRPIRTISATEMANRASDEAGIFQMSLFSVLAILAVASSLLFWGVQNRYRRSADPRTSEAKTRASAEVSPPRSSKILLPNPIRGVPAGRRIKDGRRLRGSLKRLPPRNHR